MGLFYFVVAIYFFPLLMNNYKVIYHFCPLEYILYFQTVVSLFQTKIAEETWLTGDYTV